jgi:hypothetical protein
MSAPADIPPLKGRDEQKSQPAKEAQLRQKRGKENKTLCGAAVLASPRFLLSPAPGSASKSGEARCIVACRS